MMAFLIEFEIGVEAVADANVSNFPLDHMMDKAIENRLFMKYLKYATLQSTKHALKYTEEHLQEVRQKDLDMINYASWTKN